MKSVKTIDKIIVAPCSFKGSLTSNQICNFMEQGILNLNKTISIIKIPIADGGEGTVDCILHSKKGKKFSCTVKDPLMRNILADYGITEEKIAIIEMAASSGLPLLKQEERNPLITTTYGTGQLIKDALDRGCQKIILGLGGSATNDCGHGMAMSLGAKYFDKNFQEVSELGGGILNRIEHIDLTNMDTRIYNCEFIAACDVKNPLIGPHGASKVFGPQKGATKEMTEVLDQNLTHFGTLLEKISHKELKNKTGAGAAGGLGAGVLGFLKAKFQRGIDIIKEISNFDSQIANSSLILTGEGCIDGQTLEGKAIMGILESALKYEVPCIALCGRIGVDGEKIINFGMKSIFSIVDGPMTEEEAIRNSGHLITSTTERILRLLLIN